MTKYGLPVGLEETKTQEELSVVMVVDVSGSMSGAPLDDAMNAMCNFVQAMDFSNTRVGILAVSDNTEIVSGLTDNESACLRAIQSIDCGLTGYGNMAHPFSEIKQMLQNEEGRLFAVVLADGVWNDQPSAVSAAQLCNAANIETAAIGFGGADEQFLKDISSNDANAMFVSQSELSNAFGTIAQSLGGQSAISGVDGTASDTETWEE
jgi:molecular chaperone DnaK